LCVCLTTIWSGDGWGNADAAAPAASGGGKYFLVFIYVMYVDFFKMLGVLLLLVAEVKFIVFNIGGGSRFVM